MQDSCGWAAVPHQDPVIVGHEKNSEEPAVGLNEPGNWPNFNPIYFVHIVGAKDQLRNSYYEVTFSAID